MAGPSVDLASEHGVSLALARSRADTLGYVRYVMSLMVPADPTQAVTGQVVVRFAMAAAGEVVFDFVSAPSNLRGTEVNGLAATPRLTAEHVVIPVALTRPGENTVAFDFIADSAALNRQLDFLYSLFVPARARLVFPCFDQPDLKARFTLTLNVPAGWEAVSNTPIDIDIADKRGRVVRFRETEPLPTYLFAFAAGRLAVERGSRGGRTFQVWHRELDRGLIERNVGDILDLHSSALSFLESYTGVPYPFSQFDMVLVPSFQFSGMEHPGAILYNAGRLLLESTASEHDRLTRASLIAHETAHIWFGDLVTMRWFSDVWLKEVFANFMAEKVPVHVLPTQNRDLRFFLANYPSAYAVDRSEGANQIRQPLENLAEAGQLYGPIVYLKAPVVFRQLEMMLGEERFRDGVRRYLRAHLFGNATWDDLLTHLSSDADTNVREWSAAWIDEPGRPTLTVRTSRDGEGRLAGVSCDASDPVVRGRVWRQEIQVTLGYPDRVEHLPLSVGLATASVRTAGPLPSYVLGGGGGLGYAHFPLDDESRQWLLDHAEDIPDALTRAVAWVALWEELLEGQVPAVTWLTTSIRGLGCETDPQNTERLLAVVVRAFWLFLSVTERDAAAPALEACLERRLRSARTVAERSSWFAAMRQVTMTTEGCGWLERVWRREDEIPGLSLRESDETTLALDIAVRAMTSSREILDEQRDRIQDSERRERFSFLVPALSDDLVEREAAFARLGDRRARTREPWVLTSLQYLNHPLRQAHARRFIRPGLELLPDIQRSGDIFFPARWAEALLSGHASPAAAVGVREFLAEHDDLAPRLRNAVLVAADLLFRAGRPPYLKGAGSAYAGHHQHLCAGGYINRNGGVSR